MMTTRRAPTSSQHAEFSPTRQIRHPIARAKKKPRTDERPKQTGSWTREEPAGWRTAQQNWPTSDSPSRGIPLHPAATEPQQKKKLKRK
ncbi:hypothetical protein N658DRAFT_491719 [Parathielavia hyrcaniae]|uniref:Uncharacterized protein n=1 Tax=Parathielavia hyrcaniae TaxID=113614 RepID=A0AAN6Q7W8_9PEZI|nr:hypothetical protein N658DRAFT_491719 [Parathielavia hyrcaniae]